MNKYLIHFLLSMMVLGCGPAKPLFNSNSFSNNSFEDKYKTQLDADETILESAYHYIYTVNDSNEYIARVFFPETKQITAKVQFKTRTFNSKHGKATYWYDKGTLWKEGSFENNKRTGLWKEYHFETGQIKQQNNYKNGLRNGLSKTFNKKGILINSTNYEKGLREGKSITRDSLSNIVKEVIYQSDTIVKIIKANKNSPNLPERFPCWKECNSINESKRRKLCSDRKILKYIQHNLIYPEKARKYGIEGTAIISFTVGKDGAITQIVPLSGVNANISRACIQLIKNMPPWEAGSQDGKKVKVKFNLPIRFRLSPNSSIEDLLSM